MPKENPINSKEVVSGLKKYLAKKYQERRAPFKGIKEVDSLVEQEVDLEKPERWLNCINGGTEEYENIPPVFPRWLLGENGPLTKLEYFRRNGKTR
jgi:hypothetical protein